MFFKHANAMAELFPEGADVTADCEGSSSEQKSLTPKLSVQCLSAATGIIHYIYIQIMHYLQYFSSIDRIFNFV